MKVGGIVNKVKGKAQLLGGILGWFSEPATQSVELTIAELKALFQNPKHMQPAIDAVVHRAGELFGELLMPYAGLELAKEIGVPLLGKHASAIQKGLVGYAGGFLLAAFVGNLTGRHEESFNGSTRTNFEKAPLIGNYDY